MAAVNSKIAFIQKQCNNYSQTSAEGLMYGVANIMTMKPKELDALLDQEGYDDKEMFAAEQRRASEIIRKAGLDLALIKTGSFFVHGDWYTPPSFYSRGIRLIKLINL